MRYDLILKQYLARAVLQLIDWMTLRIAPESVNTINKTKCLDACITFQSSSVSKCSLTN